MYSVLYAVSPEVFPTKVSRPPPFSSLPLSLILEMQHRGTGNGLTASANRIAGIMAPVIAIKADLTTSAPIYIAGALFISGGFLSLLLPYEARGRASI